MILLFLLPVFLHIDDVFCCYGAQYPWYPELAETTTVKIDKNNALDRNLPEAWGGFKPPASLEAKWRNWLDDYNAKRKAENEEGDEKYKHERGPGSGWPASWNGIGGGFGGAEPPPWAYVPINTGLPEFCYQPPKQGGCSQKLTRWAFNPFIAQCVEFTYSGCGENQNNFKERIKCEEYCMKMPISGCDPETQMEIEID